ncbi:hypothetical protein AAOGI_41290 [Agarivorans albus]
MKQNIVNTLFPLLLIFSSCLHANVGEVKRIYPNDERINFQLKGDDCNSPYVYYYFDASTVDGASWYSLLLSAAVSKQQVAVRFSGDNEPCDPAVINFSAIYTWIIN